LLVTGAIDDARFNYQQAGKPVLDKVRRIESVCSRHSVTLPAAAIQFPLFHPAVASVVVGHQTPREVTTNLGWLQDPIPAAFWNELLDEGLLPAGARQLRDIESRGPKLQTPVSAASRGMSASANQCISAR
jgi:D-threo-aldose 1-dehydrogenase